MPSVMGRIIAVLAGVLAAPAATAFADTCTKDDFSAIVEKAGGVLRKINADNTPQFQSKLRALKQKMSWSDKELIEKARPLVEDPTITGYDVTINDLLDQIETSGSTSAASAPDCSLLTTLKMNLDKLVEIVKAKWAYMFGKVEEALKN
jgi:hypothetical protein